MIHKVITAAWQVNKNSIVISCPSSRGGNYLIGVTQKNGHLIVAHDCPAINVGKSCWHVKAALDAYCQWQWWQEIDSTKYQSVSKKIILSPDWEQIPIPGQLPEGISEVFLNDSSTKTA
jgi:hypothetical protein